MYCLITVEDEDENENDDEDNRWNIYASDNANHRINP